MGIEGTDEIHSLDKLNNYLQMIENESNYYAMFEYAYKNCILAREEAHNLFALELIDDSQYGAFTERIEQAKHKLLQTKKKWLVNRINSSKSNLTREHIVCSVLNDIFSSEDFKNEER